MEFFGVSIETDSRETIWRRIGSFLNESSFHRIATVNPEFLLRAEKEIRFKENLKTADLRVADGFGIVLAAWLLGRRIHRITGVDLFERILSLADRYRWEVYFAVRSDGLSSYSEVRDAIQKKYPSISLSGQDMAAQSRASDIPEARKSRIVFSNFGAPEQEYFLESFRANPGKICLAIGVGGSFDYLTGKQNRAPKFLRAMGFEWLWRLFCQPRRFGRIWNATVTFLWKVMKNAILKP